MKAILTCTAKMGNHIWYIKYKVFQHKLQK